MTSEINGFPDFQAALGRYKAVVDAFGEFSPHAKAAMLKVLELAPPAFLAEAERVLEAHGAKIKARGFADDCTPLYDPMDIAGALGLIPEGHEKSWAAFLAEREAAELGTLSPTPAHRLQ